MIEMSGPDPTRRAAEGAVPYSKKYWEIKPKGVYDLSRVEKLGAVIYGQEPEGFKQWVPRSGDGLPLFEGETYYVHIHTKTNT